MSRILNSSEPEIGAEILCMHDLLKKSAGRAPGATAILAPGRAPLSYSALLSVVDSTVATLNGLGISRKDRVALVLPNGPEMAAAFLAVASGAVCAPLNPAYRATEFEFFLGDLKPRALVTQRGCSDAAISVAKDLGIPVLEITPSLESGAGAFRIQADASVPAPGANFSRPQDVALVLHTSGTTSRPKIVPLTNSALCLSAQNIGMRLALNGDDCCLNIMPLFHIHGLIGVTLSSMAVGGSIVCTPGFLAPQFFDWMRDFRPTW